MCRDLKIALSQVEANAMNFGHRAIVSAEVRAAYSARISEYSRSMLEAVRSGKVSPLRGAQYANMMRNNIMFQFRNYDLDVSRAYAISLKPKGVDFVEAIKRAMRNLKYDGQAFSSLSSGQKADVLEEVIRMSGDPRGSLTKGVPALRAAGRGLLIASILIASFNIGTSDDPWWEARRELTVFAGGATGARIGGAAMGAFRGGRVGVLGGPWGVAGGVVLGGAVGSLATGAIHDTLFARSDRQARAFIEKHREWSGGLNDRALAYELGTRYAKQTVFIWSVLNALDRNGWDWFQADTVALNLVRLAQNSPNLQDTLAGSYFLRLKLVTMLHSGWVTPSERNAMNYLYRLRRRRQHRASQRNSNAAARRIKELENSVDNMCLTPDETIRLNNQRNKLLRELEA